MAKIANIKLICFDLDGTLVNSVPDLRLALNAMMDDLQLPHCHDQDIRNWVGNGIPKMVERALIHVGKNDIDSAFFDHAVSLFEKYYAQFINSASGLYDGVAQTLCDLKSRGYQIALITNKGEKFLPPLLSHFAILDYFDLLLGGDSLSKNKPDPMQVDFAREKLQATKQQTVMVGDSRNDILAGQNADVQTIALTYGYNYGEPVDRLNPDYIIDQFNELLDLL
ncbi:phosphoglycolate phosphatase [Psychromonas sp. MME2]|uniref:phosphoglycolate phosphatase n=1 Tax=unclassified Psychromonas TaxID=2614957 RepID=UPI00339C4CD5